MEKQSDYFKYKTFSGKFSGAKVLMEQSWKDRPIILSQTFDLLQIELGDIF